MRVLDVACSIGFEDPSHFARFFRGMSGMSPREFRRIAPHNGPMTSRGVRDRDLPIADLA
jgi:AraC-like DNA-binding protein